MDRALRRRRAADSAGPAVAAVVLLGALLLGLVPLADAALAAAGAGHLTRHMSVHLLLMGLAAPLLAHLLIGQAPRTAAALAPPGTLALASTLQLALLWGWHVPPLLEAAMARPALHLAMQATLLLGALWFWLGVFARGGAQRWRAILALLLTGKLFCLLGVLLVFAPRTLYAFAHGAPAPAAALADQQLAGLLMLAACPLTYVVAGVVVSARWLGELGKRPATAGVASPDPSRRG